MDKSIILDLAFDGSGYKDNINLRENGAYSKNIDKLYAIIDNLCNDLPEEEYKKITGDFFDALGGSESVIKKVFFNEGFKLGLTMGAQNFLK